eukprot:TRINITY_DN30_c0_g1_i5.p1 TRINITY_DN30_c0_g1~~TRINITY_DN30_c0_g1_i5.p1  ORF type:complete len:288 (-),score=26.08 TRINITY_DN30_c0_g1_i5:543-1406(-)
MVVCDEEMVVDSVISASRKKSEVSLPSFGRDLVPYFIPGAGAMDESDINVNTDVDQHRRNGGGHLDIPTPKPFMNGVPGFVTTKVSSIGNNSSGEISCTYSQAATSPVSNKDTPNKTGSVRKQRSMQSSPEKSSLNQRKRQNFLSASVDSQPVKQGLSNSTYTEGIEVEQPTSGSIFEAWAGPSFSCSPPPTSLPVPSFLQKGVKRAQKNLLPTVSPVMSENDMAHTPIMVVTDTHHLASGARFSGMEVSVTDLATSQLRKLLNIDTIGDKCGNLFTKTPVHVLQNA